MRNRLHIINKPSGCLSHMIIPWKSPGSMTITYHVLLFWAGLNCLRRAESGYKETLPYIITHIPWEYFSNKITKAGGIDV